MGIWRFILAFMVLLSHTPGSYLKGNFGQMSVLAFYFISGILMAMSFERFQIKSPSPVRKFFIDRLVKLWPSYMLVFIVSLIVYPLIHIDYDWRRVIAEVFILPAAYTKMIPWGTNALTIVPPSWSLGVEAHFYLAVPLIAMITYQNRIRLAYGMAALHLLVLSSHAALGKWGCFWPIQPGVCTMPISDYLGFDLPFVVGVTFLLGTICYESFVKQNRFDQNLLAIWGMYAVSLFLLAPVRKWITNLSTYEVLFSVTFLIPASLGVFLLTKDQKPGSIDRILGNLSYPLFLVHFLARRINEYFFGAYEVNQLLLLETVILSIVFSVIIAQFQNQIVDHIRYRFRGFGNLRG
ncbi:MAG: acyltransferase [Methylobacter sp.]|jgi:peptidoglycan/LPS O-acetylase OafA/YrhL